MVRNDANAVEMYLHRNVPLTAAMGIRVYRIDLRSVELVAPLAPNRNHLGGAYGGSISSLAVTAAWMLVHWHVMDRTPEPTVVGTEQRIIHERPVTGELHAIAGTPDRAAWTDFERSLERFGRGRITLAATIEAEGETAARFAGSFVAIGG